jgi:hypothetical protein
MRSDREGDGDRLLNCFYAACADEGDSIADPLDLIDLMRDQYHRGRLLLQIGNDPANERDPLWVGAAGGIIEEDIPRSAEQRLYESESLEHSKRISREGLPRGVREARQMERSGHIDPSGPCGESGQCVVIDKKFDPRHPSVTDYSFRHVTDPLARNGLPGFDSVDDYTARIGAQEAKQTSQKGTLAGAVRTDDTQNLAVGN